MALVNNMWVKYKLIICGTITPRERKSFQDREIPFLNMYKG